MGAGLSVTTLLLVVTSGFAQIEPTPESTTTAPTTTAPVPASTASPTAAPTAPTVPATAPTTVLVVPVPVTQAPVSVVSAESTTEIPTVVVVPDSTDTSTTSTTEPETSTTTIAFDPTAIDSDDDATPETPPQIGIPVLPPAKIPPRNESLEKILNQLTIQQKKLVAIAQKRADEATARLAKAEAAIDVLKERQAKANADLDKINVDLAATKEKLRQRALAVLAGSEVEQLDSILSANDANDFARTLDLVGAAQQDDTKLITDYRSQVQAINDKNAELNQIVADKQLELDTITSEQAALGDALLKVQQQLASITTGASIALGGFVFPVGTPFSFWDSFGAPRLAGTPLAHAHQGTDIMAPGGTPLYAVNRGVVTRVGMNRLGGWRLWLIAADGTEYYYAHLSAYAEGIHDGSFVDAGQVIGFVGNTGDARGGATHLHFEIHPGGGPAVNPYPFLDAVRRTDVGALLRANQAAAAAVTTVVPPTIPGEIRAGIGFVQTVSLADSVAAGTTATTAPGNTSVIPYRPVPTVATTVPATLAPALSAATTPATKAP